MGFLSEGNVLPWEEAKKYANFIRQQGILQFLNIYKNAVTRNGDSFKWGDEVCVQQYFIQSIMIPNHKY